MSETPVSENEKKETGLSALFSLTFLKYIFSAVSSCLLDLGLFKLFCVLFDGNAWLFSTGLYITVATFLARILSAGYNYLLNYRVVFKSESSHARSLSRYVLLCVVQVCVSALLVTVLHRFIGGEELLCKLPVDFCLFLVNYFIQREHVYK